MNTERHERGKAIVSARGRGQRPVQSALAAVVLWFAPVSALAASGLDPWEFNPCQEVPLISATWGTADGEFDMSTDFDGRGPFRGPGPFAVDESGFIYILDGPRDELEVYDAHGHWQRSISLPPRAGEVVVDLAVAHGVAAFLVGETKLQLVDLWEPSSLVITTVPNGPLPGTTWIPGSLQSVLVTAHGGIYYVRLDDWACTRVTDGPVRLAPEQWTTDSGIPTTFGIRLGTVRAFPTTGSKQFESAPLTAANGTSVRPGDLVRMSPDGEILSLFAAHVGWPMGSNKAQEIVVYDVLSVGSDPYVSYLDVYSSEARLLSRTRVAQREFVGIADLGPRYRIGEGCYYEIWMSREGLNVSKWMR